MLSRSTYFFILHLFLVGSDICSAGDAQVRYSLHKEVITVKSTSEGFTSSVLYKGHFSSLQGRETPILYTQLESLGGIRGKYKVRNKFRDLPEKDIHNITDVNGQSEGLSRYVISWPSQGDSAMDFNFAYKVNGSELMTLNTLLVNDLVRTDTFDYELRVPKELILYFKMPEGIDYVHVDSTTAAEGVIYHFRSSPPGPILLNRQLEDYEFNQFPPRFIQLIVVPVAYQRRAWNWLNDWYLGLDLNNPAPNPKTIAMLDAVVRQSKSPDTIARKLFDYVKTRINYKEEENGLGAYRPGDLNLVLLDKKGDCKDMSFLLCQALNHYGIQSWIALSATLSHEFDLGFPSLSSANHMICVARIGSQTYYLDATDPVCPFGYPSLHIQDRNIFLITKQGGELLKVPVVPSGQNKMREKMYLQPNGTVFEGSFEAIYQGLSRHSFMQSRFAYSPSDYSRISQKEQEAMNERIDYSDWTPSETDTTEVFKANVRIQRDIFGDMKPRFLLNFLPFPHKFPKAEKTCSRIITYQTQDNRFEINIDFGKTISMEPFLPVHFNKEGFRFDFEASQDTDRSIRIVYSYSFEDVCIPPSKTKTYFELNELIRKTLESAIIYE